MAADLEELAKTISRAIEAREFVYCIELLENYQNVVTGDWIDENNLLYEAVAYGAFDLARVMVLKFKANPNARTYGDGDTILTSCADGELVKFVVEELKADPNYPADEDTVFFDEAGNQYYETSLHIFLENKSFELIHALLDCVSILPPEIPGRGYLSFYVNPENPADWPVIKKLCEKGAVDFDGLMLRRICLTEANPTLLRLCNFLCTQTESGQVYPSQFVDVLLDETKQARNYSYIPLLYRLTAKRFDAEDAMSKVLLGRSDLIPYIDTSQSFMIGKCIAKAVEYSATDALSALLQRTGLGLGDADLRHVNTGLLREEWAGAACQIALEHGDLAIGMYVLSRPENDLSSVAINRIVNNDPNVELEKIEAILATSLKNEAKQNQYPDQDQKTLPDLTISDILCTEYRRDIFASLLKYNMIGPFSLVDNLPPGAAPSVHAKTRGNAELIITFTPKHVPMKFLEYLVEASQKFVMTRLAMENLSLVQMVSSRVQPPQGVILNENSRVTPEVLRLVQDYVFKSMQ
jgi:hypothetical protein